MTAMTATPAKYSLHLKPHETDKMGHVPFDFQKMSFTIDALKKAKLKKKLQKQMMSLILDALKTKKLEKKAFMISNLN